MCVGVGWSRVEDEVLQKRDGPGLDPCPVDALFDGVIDLRLRVGFFLGVRYTKHVFCL